MVTLRSLAAKLAVACALVLTSAVPVFAANSFNAGNTSGATAASVTAPKPSGLAAGDVLIASVAVRSNSATTITPVASWNFIAKRITNSGNPDTQLSTYWKTADAADVAGAGFQFNLSPNVAAHAGVARYDDVAVTAATPIANNVTNPAADGNNQNNPVRALSVTTTEPGQYVHAIYAADDDATLSTPSGMSALYNNPQATGENGRLAAFDVSQAAAGASGNKDSTASANVAWTSQTLALKVKPTKLGFSTPARTGVVDECLGPITVQTQNTAGVAVKPLSSTQVNLATNETGSFFTDSSCATTAVTNGTIGTSDTGFTFYYKPTARGSGSHQITATDNAAVLTQAQQTQTVKLTQTITFAQPPSPQVYGDSFGIGSATSDSGLTVTVTPSGGCTLLGTTATVTSATTDCTLTASQAGDSTYAPAQNVVRTVVTDPRPITVTADSGQSKVYNNGNSNPTYTYQVTSGNLVGSDTLSGALARAAGENVSGSPYAINQGTLSGAGNYTITFVGANFAITPRPSSVNANNKSKTYGNNDPTLDATLTNLAPGHSNRNQAGITGTESCTRDAGETVAGSPYTITCTPGTLTAANGNYSFSAGTTANFTINRKQISINANPASKVYAQSDPAFTGVLSGFVNGEDATSAGVTGSATCSRAGSQENAGTYTGVITCAAGTLAAANYSFATGTAANFTITKVPLAINAQPGTKVYGQSDPTFTGTLSGFVNGEDATSAGVTGSANCPRTGSQENVGTYDDVITCAAGTLNATNYSFTTGTPADFEITKKQLSVDADPKSKIYGASDPAFTATLNGFAFTDTAAVVTGSANCSRAGTDENVGTYTDVISCTTGNLDASNYSFAVGDTADFTITKKQLSVDADPQSKVYGASDPSFTATLNGFALGEDETSAGVTGSESCSRAGTDELAGTYTDVISCTTGTLDAANYSFAVGDTADFTITKKPVDGSFTAANKEYDGDADATITGSDLDDTDLVGADVVTLDDSGATASFANKDVGIGKTVTGASFVLAGADKDNYQLVLATTTADITKKQLDVNADPGTKAYGDADPPFTGTLSGFVAGENATSANVTGAATCTRSGADEALGTYDDVISCVQGTLAALNYSFASGTPADFTITKRPIDGSFTAANKMYDGGPNAGFSNPVLDSGDIVGADVVTLDASGATASFANENVGNGKTVTGSNFVLAGADKDNYTLVLATTTANITPKPAGGSFTAANKVYDGTTAATVNSRSVNTADVIGGDTVTLTGGTATFANKNVGAGKTVTLAGATLGGADGSNYSLSPSSPTTTADITVKHVTGAFTAADKVYDGGAGAGVTGRSVTGAASGDSLTLSDGTASFADKTAGSNKTVTLSGAALAGGDVANYTLDGVSTDTADIAQKSVTGSFTAADKDFDGTTAATITARALTGAIAGDVVALTGGTATFNNANPGAGKPVTGTGFSLGGADAANYTLASVGPTTATIRQRGPAQNEPPTEEELEQAATAKLGGDVKPAGGLSFGTLGFAFAPSDQGGSLPPANQNLFGVGCTANCDVTAGQTLVLTGQAGASAAATKKVKLKTQKMSLAAGQIGVIKLKLTKKQKKAIKKAKKAKLVVKVTIVSGGETVTDKKTYRLKAKSG